MNEKIETKVYHKPTDTGLYTAQSSFCDNKYKKCMIKGMVYRVWRISSTYKHMVNELDCLKNKLMKNGYNLNYVETIIGETLNAIMNGKKNNGDKVLKVRVIVPFSKGYKQFANGMGSVLNEKYAKGMVISKSTKIIIFFSNKSSTPKEMQSNLVHKFECNGCRATYIGDTSSSLHTN